MKNKYSIRQLIKSWTENIKAKKAVWVQLGKYEYELSISYYYYCVNIKPLECDNAIVIMLELPAEIFKGHVSWYHQCTFQRFFLMHIEREI